MKLSANKQNFQNITKSGLRQIQFWTFHIVKGIIKDLVQTTRDARGALEVCPKNAVLGQQRHFVVEEKGLVADDLAVLRLARGQANLVESVCTHNSLIWMERIREAEAEIEAKHAVLCERMKAKRMLDLQKRQEMEQELKLKIKQDRRN